MPTVDFLENGNVKVSIPILLRSRAGRRRVFAPEVVAMPVDPVVQSIVRAFRWQQMIDEGIYDNVHELANALGKDYGYIARTIRLALLCPAIVRAALNGTLPYGVSLETLRLAVVDDWEEQMRIVGLK